MSGLLNVLEKIRQRPGMYLGRPSVSDLFMFLVGYEFSRSELGIDLTEPEQKFYDEFHPGSKRSSESQPSHLGRNSFCFHATTNKLDSSISFNFLMNFLGKINSQTLLRR